VPNVFVDRGDKTEAGINHKPTLAHLLEHLALAVEHVLLALCHEENETKRKIRHTFVKAENLFVLSREQLKEF